MHSPEHAEEAQEARRLSHLRRKREATLAGAYDFSDLGTIGGLRRILEVAILDTLSIENSLSRNRTLAYLVMVALKASELGEMEMRLAALEQAVQAKPIKSEASVFELGPGSPKSSDKEIQ